MIHMIQWLLLIQPWADLSDSLTTLSNFATQVQKASQMVLTHPIWAILLLIFSIGFLQLIVDLIKRSVRASLTFILKLPLIASQWLWQRAIALPNPDPANHQPDQVDQIDQLMARLEQLRQEQDQIITHLKTLLSNSPPSPFSTAFIKSSAFIESSTATPSAAVSPAQSALPK